MQIVIAKNISETQLMISDLGKYLEIDEILNLSDYFSYEEIASSRILKTHISREWITINDGFNDLSVDNAIKYLSIDDMFTQDKESGGATELDNLCLANDLSFTFSDDLLLTVH